MKSNTMLCRARGRNTSRIIVRHQLDGRHHYHYYFTIMCKVFLSRPIYRKMAAILGQFFFDDIISYYNKGFILHSFVKHFHHVRLFYTNLNQDLTFFQCLKKNYEVKLYLFSCRHNQFFVQLEGISYLFFTCYERVSSIFK